MREYELEKRRFVIAGLIIVISVLYIVRLFNLQVADETFKKNADSNAFLRKTIYPSRGMIYDRKGRLIVFNQPAYDVMVIPKEIHDLDSLDLCSTLQITLPELRKKFEEMRDAICRSRTMAAFRRSSTASPDSSFRKRHSANTTAPAAPTSSATSAR